MADIQPSEIKHYRSQVVDDSATNGGPIDETAEVISGAAQNLFPTRFAADRAAGKTQWRKLYSRVENADNNVLEFAGQGLASITISPDDHVVIIDGSSIDTQGDITGAEDHYGVGSLNATVTPGATTVDVLVEPNIPVIFRDGATITIQDATNVEQRTLSGAPSNVGDVWTLTFSVGLANGYSSTDTFVSSIIDRGSVKGSFSNVNVTSAAGTYDHTQTTVNSIGAVDDFITISFTSATAYDVSGPFVGSLGSGNVGSTFSPTNPNTGTPYFSIPPAAWGGTFTAGDQVTQNMNGAIMVTWFKNVLDAGAGVTGGNKTQLYTFGESAAP